MKNAEASRKSLTTSWQNPTTCFRQIGALMKSGKTEEGMPSNRKPMNWKERSKELNQTLTTTEEELKEILVRIPNLPHASVPKGKGAQDNQVDHEEGIVPVSDENAIPHWDPPPNTTSLISSWATRLWRRLPPFYKGKGARLQRASSTSLLNRPYIQVTQNMKRRCSSTRIPATVQDSCRIKKDRCITCRSTISCDPARPKCL